MQKLFFLLLISICSHSAEVKRRGHVTDPMITLKCNHIFDDRERKVGMRQKAKALLWRNRGLLKKAPLHRDKAINKLKYTSQRLTQEITLLSLKIDRLEEELIRKGCPGIRL